jgi:putative ABC transport system substrate-binding protein
MMRRDPGTRVVALCSLWSVVAALSGAAAFGVASAAEDTQRTAATNRVVHVCDCPAEHAGDERNALLQAFGKRGFEQGRNLDLVTYDVNVLGPDPKGAGPLSLLGNAGAGKPYADFLSRLLAIRQPRLILASGIRVAQGAREASGGTPVIFWRLTDPMGFDLIQTLAQPGGNLTGFSRAIEKLTPKRLELLHEMLPAVRRIGFVWIEDFDHHRAQAAEVRRASEVLGLTVTSYALPSADWTPERLDAVFATMRRDRVEAFLLPDINVQPRTLVELATKYKLPTIYPLPHAVSDWGGLAAYSTSAPDELTKVVDYAVRILRGENPRALPVQEPTQYELVLNLKAAREMGLSFPVAFKMRATSVVEK